MKNKKEKISVGVVVNKPMNVVWEYWNNPEHIIEWYHASDDWCVLNAKNNLEEGKNFNIYMSAKDRSAGFDFNGKYDKIIEHEYISYTIEDGRKVKISFEKSKNGVKITEIFEPENENSIDLQRKGWQAILDSFKKYVESQ